MSTAANANSAPGADPVADIKANLIQIAAAPIMNALSSIENNPSTLNVFAQVAALQGAFVGALPALETVGIKDLATLAKAKLAEIVANASGATAAAPATATPSVGA